MRIVNFEKELFYRDKKLRSTIRIHFIHALNVLHEFVEKYTKRKNDKNGNVFIFFKVTPHFLISDWSRKLEFLLSCVGAN